MTLGELCAKIREELYYEELEPEALLTMIRYLSKGGKNAVKTPHMDILRVELTDEAAVTLYGFVERAMVSKAITVLRGMR